MIHMQCQALFSWENKKGVRMSSTTAAVIGTLSLQPLPR